MLPCPTHGQDAADSVKPERDPVKYLQVESSPGRIYIHSCDRAETTISGKPGFWTVFTYKTKDELKLKVVYCGVLDGEWFYGIRYSAAQRHYFDKDLKTFETVLRSFKLKTNA